MEGWGGQVGQGRAGLARGLALICAVLALMLQINAPIRMALMDADPAAAAALCAQHEGGPSNPKSPDALHHDCGACAVCSVVALSLSLLALGLFALSVTCARPKVRVSVVGPRGPPLRQPQARGPPLYA